MAYGDERPHARNLASSTPAAPSKLAHSSISTRRSRARRRDGTRVQPRFRPCEPMRSRQRCGRGLPSRSPNPGRRCETRGPSHRAATCPFGSRPHRILAMAPPRLPGNTSSPMRGNVSTISSAGSLRGTRCPRPAFIRRQAPSRRRLLVDMRPTKPPSPAREAVRILNSSGPRRNPGSPGSSSRSPLNALLHQRQRSHRAHPAEAGVPDPDGLPAGFR
jgi:hypothetical protein